MNATSWALSSCNARSQQTLVHMLTCEKVRPAAEFTAVNTATNCETKILLLHCVELDDIPPQ